MCIWEDISSDEKGKIKASSPTYNCMRLKMVSYEEVGALDLQMQAVKFGWLGLLALGCYHLWYLCCRFLLVLQLLICRMQQN